MAYLRGKYGPYPGFDVGDLTRKRYSEIVARKAGLWPGDRALDVACGHGTVSNAVARAFTKCRVAAVDADAAHLARARENARVEGADPRLDFVRATSAELPFEDESFLLTTCALGLAFEPAHLEVLAEMHRVTSFMGKVLVVDVDFTNATKRPPRAKKSVLGAETRAAMREMGFGKIHVQRVDTMRDGTALLLLSAKRFDVEGEGPEGDEENGE